MLHTIEPEASPPIAPEAEEPPLYGSFSELSDGLEFLHLSSAEGALWGAAGKSPKAIDPGRRTGAGDGGAPRPGRVEPAVRPRLAHLRHHRRTRSAGCWQAKPKNSACSAAKPRTRR